MTLKQKIMAGVGIIIICCIGIYCVLDTQIKKNRNQVDDEVIVSIYDSIRLSNEEFHANSVGQHLQKLAQKDAVFGLLANESVNDNITIIKGLFLTLENKAQITRITILDDNYKILLKEENKFAVPCKENFYQSDVVKKLCSKAAESWENEARMVALDGSPCFVITTAVVDDEDEAIGFVLGFLPVDILAKSLAENIGANIIFQRLDGKIFASSDKKFFEEIKSINPSIESRSSKVIKTSSNAFLTYAIPISYPDQKETTGRYWVSREYSAPYKLMQKLNLIRISLIGIVLIASVGLTFLLLVKVLNPLLVAKQALNEVAQGEGDLSRTIEIKTKDEVGELADGFNTFIGKIRQMVKQIVKNAEKLDTASDKLTSISDTMSDNSKKVSEKTHTVSLSSEEMSNNMTSVSTAMDLAAENVNLVAAAAEQMTATINEIAKNTEEARGITQEAVSKASDASEKVNELGSAAQLISKVIDTITDISEQVNLLALNATIEAARAGEAGKGFAVVANEIKELAGQTAAATSEITKHIQGIQNSTQGTVSEIKSITQVVDSINEIVGTIAAAIEEQSATTEHIAQNANNASTGIQQVSENISENTIVSKAITDDIAEVTQRNEKVSENSQDVNQNAVQLSELAKQLNSIVSRFKI
jgi:methyl-accepting chemotaxis protein